MKSLTLLFICVAGATVLPRKERPSLGPDKPYFPCGVKKDDLSPRVGNGEEAEPYSIPWQVYVKTNRGGNLFGKCGGTIIGPYHIMTAAHCVDKGAKASDVTVTVAEHNLRGKQHEKRHYVSCIMNHPGYNDKTLNKDFSILVLEKRIEFNDKAAAACLPIDNLDETYEGKTLTVSGWGNYNHQDKGSDILLHTNVQGISNNHCLRKFPFFTKFMLCATFLDGKIGSVTCGGDSGGPVTYNDNNKVTLVGVVSFGQNNVCGTKEVSGYARITSVMDWILDSGVYKKGRPTCPSP